MSKTQEHDVRAALTVAGPIFDRLTGENRNRSTPEFRSSAAGRPKGIPLVNIPVHEV